ncbi:unnamed protein product [Rotaria socialis]|uniref:Fatty acid desaturase domain-containing protein n=1 Tax=Rotaria socialis TaxID=392032 RepID=A0A820V3C0_9BILA|nr:unnamed protein product [Rotaria socialis]
MGREECHTNLDEYQLKDQNLNAVLPTTSDRLPTLSEIKVKLPEYCFRPSFRQSIAYVIKDIFFVIFALVLMYKIEHLFQYGILLWPLYWYFQGTIYMALFVLGHDCGHGSFSVYPLLNDTIGTLLHTWILIPYYPWKITHKNHHKNTGNIDKDEAYYPLRIESYKHTWIEDNLVYAPGLAWFHYLIFGYGSRKINHFNLCYLMYLFVIHVSIINLICYNIIPVFIFACYFVIVTFLHHIEIDVPWFVDLEWNYVKGQLSTVDRHYGHIHSLIHSIGTHQIHHLFAKIPHYHLETATMHFRKAFSDLVRVKHNTILPSFIRMFKLFLRQRTIGQDVYIFAYVND